MFITSCEPGGAKKYEYCGEIIDKGYEPPTSGYKSNKEASYYILMKENKSQKVIRINVTIPTYYSINKGDLECFILSNWNLYYAGNTIDMSKNLYEQ